MSLVTRTLCALLADGATGVLATGVVDPGALAADAGLVAADQPGASEVALGRLAPTLVCPPAPRLQAEVAEDAGGTDEDFQAAGTTTSSTLVRSLASSGEAAVSGRTLPLEDAAAAEDLSGAGEGTAAASTGSQDPVVVQAAASQLLAGLQVTSAEDGDLAGVAASSCTAPAETSWLVGGAVETGRSGLVLLSNPSATTAVVDLTVLTPDGPVSPPAAQDLAVGAGTSREVLLESLLEPTDAVAVGVSARGAAVAAQLVETQLDGVLPHGVEHVAATTASTALTIPGVLAAGRTLTLRVANPGADAAAVGWQVLGADGVLPLVGEAVVTVPAGGVVDLPLDLSRPDGTPVDGPVAVQVGSDQPVVGAVQVQQPYGAGRSERAWAQSAPALQDEALALVATTEGVRTFLSVASADAAEVLVQQLDADGEPAEDELTLTLAPGTTRTERIGTDVAAVRLKVVSGSVHAALPLTADAPGGPAERFVAVVPVQVPPPTTDAVTVAPLPADVLSGPGTP